VDVNVAIDILLAAASASVALTALGVLISRDPYQRLHFLAPAAAIGTVCVTAAILLRESLSQIGMKTLIAAAVIFLMNPVLTHATARAARVRDQDNRRDGGEE
jgi:monovalent cation/proton antiporter MnhG/PhaG subunit